MDCPICLSDETESDATEKIYVTLPCQHTCCLQCFASLKKFECMLCRKDVEALVPESIKHPKKDEAASVLRYYAMINDHDLHLAMLGVRLRREVLRARIRRLRDDDTEIPLLLYDDDDDDDPI